MIIVTGGAGLIGSNIVRELNNRGRNDIVIVDNLRKSIKWKNLVNLKYSDYIEKERFYSEFNSFEKDICTIFHMGACSNTTEENNSYLVENNFQLSKDLFLFALQKKARFIYASSAATYGEGEHGYNDDEASIDNLKPLNMYGYSKQMFDQWLINNGYMKKAVGLKYFNVFGPNEYHKEDMRSLVLKAYHQILNEERISLFKSYRPEYKDGEQKRDFLYVKDAAKMSIHFMENKETGIYNIGTGKSRSWNELAYAIFSALKKETHINYIKMPESLKKKYQYYTKANINKILSTGYNEQLYSLEEAVHDYVTNYLTESKHT